MLDAGGGGGAPAATDWASTMESFARSTASFAAGAAAGKIAVSQTGGDALLQAVRTMMQWVDDNSGDLNMLAQQPALGGSRGAEVMKPYVANVAMDGQGFIPMLKKFRESLDQTEQGILDAMKNYQAMDQDGSARLT